MVKYVTLSRSVIRLNYDVFLAYSDLIDVIGQLVDEAVGDVEADRVTRPKNESVDDGTAADGRRLKMKNFFCFSEFFFFNKTSYLLNILISNSVFHANKHHFKKYIQYQKI